MTSKTILLTGATGFVGQKLVKTLLQNSDLSLRIAVREMEENPTNLKIFRRMDLSSSTDWQEALKDCDLVIHTAARVHVMKDLAEDPLEAFRKVNVEGTLNLARQAAHLGIKRFIFISSIKVNGEFTLKNQFFTANDSPNPSDPYAISKFEAEEGLKQLAASTDMEVVIIRPPLVYGFGVKGNFQRMMAMLEKGIPLPLSLVKNKRSFVSLENLVSLILKCIEHPKAANQTFLVSDGEDLSVPELLQKMGKTMNKSVYLFPIPPSLLNLGATLLGKKDVFQRLCGSMQLDISKTSALLDWQPAKKSEFLEL